MTTSLNSTQSARDVTYHMVHYLRKAIGPALNASGTIVTVGVLPAGANVLSGGTGLYFNADFSGAGTSGVIDVGFAADSVSTADGNAYVTTVNTPATTAGYFIAFDELATTTARPRAVDTTVTATWTGAGTTGEVVVIVAYAPAR